MGSATYVPALRWKRAERGALQSVSTGDREWITPLIELAPREFRVTRKQSPAKADNRVLQFRDELNSVWPSQRVFVDAGMVFGLRSLTDGRDVLQVLLDRSDGLDLRLVPVISMTSSDRFLDRITEAGYPQVALRVPVSQMLAPGGLQGCRSQVHRLGHAPDSTHLIVDFGYLRAVEPLYRSVAGLTSLGEYASVTLLGGAFPEDLTKMTVGRREVIRHEWASWLTVEDSPAVGFGDWTIQHPVYRELPTDHPNFSASIRYAAQDRWIVMRGEGVFKAGGPGFAQWPANAQMLMRQPEFCGAPFSAGDRYIAEMAAQTDKTGSAETWLKAGISHHLTMAARQVRDRLV